MKRPYIIINCAMSSDGKIALPSRKQIRISSREDIERVYKLRNECDAVLVGIETILSDNPKLTVNENYVKNPKQPLRVILDSNCRTPTDSLALSNNAKTLIFTSEGKKKSYQCDHIEIIECEKDPSGLISLDCILEILYKKGIKKLLVEGGGTIIWNFLNKGLFEDFYTYIGPIIIGGKNTPTVADGYGVSNNPISLKIHNVRKLGNGILLHYKMIK